MHRPLALALLLAAPAAVSAQVVYLPGDGPATIVRVRTPDDGPASGATVEVLGLQYASSTNGDGLAIFPTLRRGDYLVTVQTSTDTPVLRSISLRGFADTVQLRLPRRMPTIRMQNSDGGLDLHLARAADRRAQGPDGLLASPRLQRFRSIAQAAESFSPQALNGTERCVRISRNGLAPEGARLLRLGEAPAALPVGHASVARPEGRTTDADRRALEAKVGDVQAIEWIDAIDVPFSFVGVPHGCDVVVIWR